MLHGNLWRSYQSCGGDHMSGWGFGVVLGDMPCLGCMLRVFDMRNMHSGIGCWMVSDSGKMLLRNKSRLHVDILPDWMCERGFWMGIHQLCIVCCCSPVAMPNVCRGILSCIRRVHCVWCWDIHVCSELSDIVRQCECWLLCQSSKWCDWSDSLQCRDMVINRWSVRFVSVYQL